MLCSTFFSPDIPSLHFSSQFFFFFSHIKHTPCFVTPFLYFMFLSLLLLFALSNHNSLTYSFYCFSFPYLLPAFIYLILALSLQRSLTSRIQARLFNILFSHVQVFYIFFSCSNLSTFRHIFSVFLLYILCKFRPCPFISIFYHNYPFLPFNHIGSLPSFNMLVYFKFTHILSHFLFSYSDFSLKRKEVMS